MPNTSKGFPYPVATDDPNIPADIQSLAQAIDTYLNNYSQTTHTHTGVYATSAHNHDGVYSVSAHVHSNYLTSSDLTGYSQTTHNHDASYSTTGHTHSNYIATSLISSTKGSMPVGTGTGVSTITPGANDYALLSDSSTSTGLKWASLAAVGTVIPNTFSNIAVSGQTTVSADQQSDTLTLTAGSNITLTTNNTTNTVTITGSNAGVTTHEAAADPHAQYLTTTEANSVYEQIGAASLAQTAAAAYTDTAISNLVNSAPTTLNTLKELSDALGGDAAFATTVTNSIAAKAPLASPTFTGTVSGISKSMVGLGNVDNTSDASKPVSTATQTALDLKLSSATASTTYAPIASPTFTGTVSGVTKSMVGLSNVDNTTDANKPISTATQTALDAKAPIASPTFTGTVSASAVSVSGNLISHITINPQTASYSLDISDDGKIVEMSVSAANTVTIPPSSSQNFTVGSQIIIVQSGTGKTTIQQGSGVTINSRGNVATAPELAGQWASCVLIYRGSDSWLVTGDIA